ncbi:aminotransferase class III-fold pyridoxal phosphate-dependent enzyme [Burkholderia ambifaria]|uniref:aminotransferase class III-fold pyridoxal phosphate-dependent enzyme n=1 Tax=Burkholderia ambifaria TaxID=152480 RepID=UPI00158BFC90|nr:aminotransferase class III-fold pyridoxal phosphate-dependent enzyme [Burkholderia ambifaria]MBR8343529.1 aminotransferase class III-fold pyridoxal phosphate-dependent enzyme [Burkholderia ambifaria]
MSNLWDLASRNRAIGIDELDPELRSCVRDGDGVADHYGGRTSFTFIDQRDDEILLLERLDGNCARVGTAFNLTGGYGTGILGDGIKDIAADLPRFLANATTTNDEFHSVERSRLVSRIKRLLATHTRTHAEDWDLTFTSTGSEAMDLGMQLVLLDGFNLATGIDTRRERDIVVACYGAWHGWLLGPNQILDRRQFTDGLPRVATKEVVFMRYGDIDSLLSVFSTYGNRIRAVVVEGILGDGGVVPGPIAWWDRLLDLCAREDVRLVNDEVLTGFRTGAVLAMPPGRVPDCVTLGKALGFGLFPMSAVAWRRQSLSLRAGIGVRTFNARPFQAAVVNAGLEYLENNGLFSRSESLGTKMLASLGKIAGAYPRVFKAVRGQGLLIGIELADSFARRGQAVRDEMLRHGVLVEIESGIFSRKLQRQDRINETLRLTPPLSVAEQTLTDAVERIAACAARLDGTLNSRSLETVANSA